MSAAPLNRAKPGGHVCPWWLAYTFDNPLRKFIHDPDALLDGLVRSGETVLDLGCGMGYFSIGMARLVGEQGTVIAVDIQERMLSQVRKRAAKAGLTGRILAHRSEPDRIGLDEQIDFALAFWMVHEVPDQAALFNELRSLLKESARLLIVEPRFHVNKASFLRMETLAQSLGFRVRSRPKARLSRSVLLSHGG